ncbi:MAG: LysR family transcriptional regulator [Gammaproteobacteria bacterium]
MDRFADIETFVAVVDLGSFSAAAERLGTAKSAVSRRVAQLEGRLGARLLNRTTRRLSLTDAGRALHERAKRILSDLEEAEGEVAHAEAALRGRLKVATPLSFGLLHLGPALEDFLIQHPELEVELDLNDRQVDLVSEGFDLALRIGQLTDSSLIARRISTVRRVTVASPDYLARHGTPQHPGELDRHHGLRYTNVPRQEAWSYFDAQGRPVRPRVPDRLAANNGELLADAAERGLGIAVQPTFMVHEALREGRLRAVLTDWTLAEQGMYLVYPPGRFLSQRVRAYSDHLAGCFGDRPYWDRHLA